MKLSPTERADGRTHSVLHIPLKLRTQLGVALRHDDGGAYYQLENELTGEFFRLGVPEWQLASRLDGRVTPSQALAALESSLAPSQAATVCTFLLQSGLAERVDVDQPPPSPAVRHVSNALLSVLYSRIPLLAPDRWLERLSPKVAWLFSRPAFFVWLALVLVGACCVLVQSERFLEQSRAYFFPSAWGSLVAVWLVLKAVHELAHGVVCKKYGGTVGTAGVVLIILSPIAYVDVTGAWRFRSKWQRIAVSAAGMYVEFAIAAVAAMVWAISGETYTAYLAHHVVFAASVSTLLFNANPLMRFDGYYLFADLLGVQNLYATGSASLRSLGKSLIGLEDSPSAGQLRHPHLGLVYGVLSGCWRVLVCVSLILVACRMFHGAGAVIAVVAATMWFGLPLLRVTKMLYQQRHSVAWRRVGTIAIVIAISAAMVAGVSLPYGLSVPAVVEYDPIEAVRAEADGFVTRVYVGPGERVTQGDVLLEIHDAEAIAELEAIRLTIRQAEIESRIRLQSGELSAYQADVEKIAALSERESVLTQVAHGLQVRAPMDGIVLDMYPRELAGRYVREGASLLSIGDERRKRVHLSIPEHYVEQLLAQLDAEPRIHLDGMWSWLQGARLSEIDPSASERPRNKHLLATHGGPLAVAVEQETDETAVRLVAPRFHGALDLAPDVAHELRAGQRGVARFHDRGETAGAKIWRGLRGWFDSRVAAPKTRT